MIGIGIGLWNNVAASSGGGAAGSTWNAATSSTDWVLSNGNLTATNSNATAVDRLLRGSLANTSGYFEVTPTLGAGTAVVGLATGTASTSDYPGHFGAHYDQFGAVLVNNVNVATYSTYASGDVIAVCVKQVSAGVYKLFFRKNNGSWEGGANPSTNTGGLDISSIIGTGLYPAADNTKTGAFTGAFSSGFSGSLPTGVSAWG